ncbi:MAG: hypothetical protein EBU04_10475 [Verrucomicrobia bacterium]|nr:hypothetical protein [Verrucomicrobiota bacterium]
MSTKVTNSSVAANTDKVDRTPTGYNATVVYKINDSWEGVARYTSLDTDLRGQYISEGERGFNNSGNSSTTAYNKSDAIYLGVNYYFPLEVMGKSFTGHNAKIQLGYEMSKFKGKITDTLGSPNVRTSDETYSAKLNVIRLQAQVAF